MPRLAIFDVDGTLIPAPGLEWRFAVHLMRDGRLGPLRMLQSVGFSLRWFPRFGRHVWQKNKAYLAGWSVREVEAWARRFVERHVTGLLRQAVVARLREHQRAGDTVALLTGAADFLARPLADSLGIALCRGCECEVRDNRFVAQPPRRHPFGVVKLDCMRELCQETGLPAESVIAYADSSQDLPMLRAAGEPVAVHPDRRLRREARRRGWIVLAG